MKFPALIGFLCFFSISSAQNKINSPYSISGVGLINQGGFMHQQFMGGLQTTVDSSGTFSFSNPATLCNTTLTNLEFGATFQNTRQLSGNLKSDYNTGSFEYLALALPISLKRKIGFAFGLNPYSKVNYFIQNKAKVNEDSVYTSFEGSGGLNEMRFGLGFRVYKGLSLGITSSAIFGNIKNNADKYYPKNSNVFSFRDFTTNYYSGWSNTLGVQYTGRTGKSLFHNFGASYKLSTNLKVTRDRFVRTYNGAGDFFIDTILRKTDDPTNMTLPSGFSVGYGVGDRGHWYVGLQYDNNKWSSFQDLNGQQNYFDQTKYSFGGYFQLNSYKEFEKYAGRKERNKNYLNITRLYYGLSYSNLYLNSFQDQVSELGINLGVGFPIIKSVFIDEHQKIGVISRVNVGVSYTKRGNNDNNLIQENIFEIKVGTNFNDKWFTKRRYQ